MRIALVIYGRPDQISGGFIYDRHLMAALAARGNSVDVVSLPWHSYARATTGGLLGGGARLDSARYDVVIEDELVHPSVFKARVSNGRPARIALCHNLRSGQPGESLRRLKTAVERRYFEGVAGVIAVCARTRDDVSALIERPAHTVSLPFVVTHPGRDHVVPEVGDADVETRAREPGPLRVLHVATVQPHKGLDRLLAAIPHAQREGCDFTLDVVGALATGGYARALQQQIEIANLGARVRFHGQLRGPALHALFRRSQVFALPSDREAYSLACLEALGYGLPVLATSHGGLGEMIADGQDGFLLDPTDGGAWSARLAELALNRARLRAMSLAARARWREHGTWAEVAARVEAFLVAVCERAP